MTTISYSVSFRATLNGETDTFHNNWRFSDRDEAQRIVDRNNVSPDRDRCGVTREYFVGEHACPPSPTMEEVGRALLENADSLTEALGG